MQPAGFAEGAAGFAGVADERGDRIAAREYAADDRAADARDAVLAVAEWLLVTP